MLLQIYILYDKIYNINFLEVFMDKSIAIIIPNYNKSKYLKECLDSAVNQTYQNKEIIFVDDCSTDNSLEIAYEYEKNYKFFISLKCL